MKRIALASLVAAMLFVGCDESVDEVDNINANKAQNSLGYYDEFTIFHSNILRGAWMEKDNVYGFENLLYFDSRPNTKINDSQVDKFYTTENYGVDITGNTLNTYKFYRDSKTEEVNGEDVTTEYYDYNKSIIEYYKYNSLGENNDCYKVSKYIKENDVSSYDKDYSLCQNGYYTEHSLATYNLTGVWIQYEFDENDTAKTDNGLGIEFLYQFNNNGDISMNISLINQWIPLGKYATNDDATILTFEEGSRTSLKQFEFVEHREPVPLQYTDDNNNPQSKDMPCIKIKAYKLNENNNTKTFDKNYQICKKY